ncbi:glycosyltransferase family 2 protein [Yoonia sediminilitoris]|uniref:glycosyltransferase family 2 protein n=1 Tax=Yoonia sediminilitoris TaxID=1286148 RepID=UPI0035C98B72
MTPGPRLSRGLFATSKLAYRLRWKRRRLLFRCLRKRHQLALRQDRTTLIKPDSILAFCCVRNEALRLPYFLQYYRALGVDHFLFVDNGSDEGTGTYLAAQDDVSLWETSESYKLSRFGMDWLGWLQMRFGHGHWCLTVDADELLAYPHHATHGLRALTGWLDQQGRPSFGALMLDLYPKGPVEDHKYHAGDDPLSVLTHFDPGNYRAQWHPIYDNLWVQGGVRARRFFASESARAPTLNKVPLVKWHRRYAYVTSTHQMLPRHLHDVLGTGAMSGILLHTKFLYTIGAKSREELERKQHFENSALYGTYHDDLTQNPDLWYAGSMRYESWQQLMELGLIAKEDWI